MPFAGLQFETIRSRCGEVSDLGWESPSTGSTSARDRGPSGRPVLAARRPPLRAGRGGGAGRLAEPVRDPRGHRRLAAIPTESGPPGPQHERSSHLGYERARPGRRMDRRDRRGRELVAGGGERSRVRRVEQRQALRVCGRVRHRGRHLHAALDRDHRRRHRLLAGSLGQPGLRRVQRRQAVRLQGRLRHRRSNLRSAVDGQHGRSDPLFTVRGQRRGLRRVRRRQVVRLRLDRGHALQRHSQDLPAALDRHHRRVHRVVTGGVGRRDLRRL